MADHTNKFVASGGRHASVVVEDSDATKIEEFIEDIDHCPLPNLDHNAHLAALLSRVVRALPSM